jgi:hypothetical protein
MNIQEANLFLSEFLKIAKSVVVDSNSKIVELSFTATAGNMSTTSTVKFGNRAS